MATEYGGDDITPRSTISGSGPEGRSLESWEQLTLFKKTGQIEDPAVPVRDEMMYGEDRDPQ